MNRRPQRTPAQAAQRYQARLNKARRLRQERRLLQEFGVLYTGDSPLTQEAWRQRFLRNLQLRLNRQAGILNRPNAERAADILKNGESARWFRARFSTCHAGSDNRGIVHHMNRWLRKYGHRAPTLFSRLATHMVVGAAPWAAWCQVRHKTDAMVPSQPHAAKPSLT